jgi:hypothetical protein
MLAAHGLHESFTLGSDPSSSVLGSRLALADCTRTVRQACGSGRDCCVFWLLACLRFVDMFPSEHCHRFCSLHLTNLSPPAACVFKALGNPETTSPSAQPDEDLSFVHDTFNPSVKTYTPHTASLHHERPQIA